MVHLLARSRGASGHSEEKSSYVATCLGFPCGRENTPAPKALCIARCSVVQKKGPLWGWEATE